jgi:hypothetical protein
MRLIPAFLLSMMMAMGAWAEESPKFTWHAFKDAIPAAQAADKIIMVDIYTDW